MKVHQLAKLALATTLLSASQLAAANTLTVYTYDSFASDWGPGPAIEKSI